MLLRNYLALLLSLWVAFTPALAQDVAFLTQSEVDAFDPATTEVSGNLSIGGYVVNNPDPITNLANLANLTSVAGDLDITATSLPNLNGLGNLVSANNLTIWDNDALLDINTLSSLGSVNNLNISGNAILGNINGMAGISALNELTIGFNSALADINGLSNLAAANNVLISNNDLLENINPLANLTATHRIEISYNDALADVNGLSNLVSVEHDAIITNNTALTDISGIGNLQFLGANLLVENNSALSNCCALQFPLVAAAYRDSIFISNNAAGCANEGEVLAADCDNPLGILEGRVFADQNADCSLNAGDSPLAGVVVEVAGENFNYYSATNADGEYRIYTPQNGTYKIHAYPPSPYWEGCEPFYLAIIPEGVLEFNIPLLANTECAHLEVDVSSWALRECFDNIYTVSYCNTGTLAAPTAEVELSLDPLLGIAEASIPFTGPDEDDSYLFDVGPLEMGECGSFTVNVQLPCQPPTGQFLGQTFCLDARILPDSICQPPDPTWDGAEIELSSECGDSVSFRISNVGGGDMGTSRAYSVIEDQVMFQQGFYILGAGQDINLSYPANGSTYRLEVEQASGFPDTSLLVEVVEGCGDEPISLGFVNQFPMYDENPAFSTECREVTGSYDPNDKQGFPYGYDEERYIERGQSIEYLVRFQNTGTDTAFTVVIRDVISPQLDLATISPGASSHAYEFQLTDSLVSFVFNDILLPDSTTNEAASHGFVKFRIWQKPDLPIGTVIENTAAIYFDFNAPIITNTTFHTIGENFVEIILPTDDPASNSPSVMVYPNPFSEVVHFEVRGLSGELELSICDALGREVSRSEHDAPRFAFQRQDLPKGIYFYQIQSQNTLITTGKLIIH